MGASNAWGDDITSLPVNYDYTTQAAVDGNVIAPFDQGTVKAGTNVKALTISSQTATAYFDSDTGTDGRQAYTLASNEKVTFTINAYHGWLTGNKKATFSIVNSEGTAIASYTYDSGQSISDVKIGGSTADGFASFAFGSSYNATQGANGLSGKGKPYTTTESYNPVITIAIYGSGDVVMNFTKSQGSVSQSFSGTLGGSVAKDLAKITVVDASENDDRMYHIGKLSIVTETLSNVTVTTQYLDGEGNKVFADTEDVISYGASFTPTYTASTSSTIWDYSYASGADEIASVTSDKIVTILYNRTAKSAYNAYNILYGQDYDLAVTTADWTTGTGGRFTPTILEEDGNRYMSVVQDTRDQNSATLISTATQGIVAAGTDFTLTFDIKMGNCNTDVPSFTIYDAANTSAIFSFTGNAKNTEKWNINNDSENPITMSGTATNTAIASLTWYSVKVTRFGANTFVTIKKKSDGSTVLDKAVATTLSSTGGIGKMTFGTGRYNGNFAMDNVIIRDVVASEDLPSAENIVVSAAGYATYVSDYNLDFSSATTKAYKVAVESKGVATLTEVSKVPAKTPVLLYCAGGNGTGEDIAITTDAVDAVTGNDLVVGTGAAVATTDGEYTNMILNNIGGNVGFYFANGQTVAANRAYLHIATTLAPDAAASRMVMVFGNEATGIGSVKSEEMKDKSEVYNLKGQRVAQPTKGLYIVNGKKVVIK